MRLWPIITALLLTLAGCGFTRPVSPPPELHTGLIIITSYRGFCTAANVEDLGLQMRAVTAKHCIIPGQSVNVQSFSGIDYGIAVVVKTFGDSALIQYTPAHRLAVYPTTTAPARGADIWLAGGARMNPPTAPVKHFRPLYSYGKYIGDWPGSEGIDLMAFAISSQPGFSGAPIFYDGEIFAITSSIVVPFPHSPWTYGVLIDELLKRPIHVPSRLGA